MRLEARIGDRCAVCLNVISNILNEKLLPRVVADRSEREQREGRRKKCRAATPTLAKEVESNTKKSVTVTRTHGSLGPNVCQCELMRPKSPSNPPPLTCNIHCRLHEAISPSFHLPIEAALKDRTSSLPRGSAADKGPDPLASTYS